MSEYNNLKPIFASSVMKISKNNLKLIFSNTITYDYLDLEKDTTWKSYMEFLKNTSNYESGIYHVRINTCHYNLVFKIVKL